MKNKLAQKITPFLWFNENAEEAVDFYTSVFPNSKIGTRTHYGDAAPRPKGTVMTVQFEIDGQEFVALNGGPYFNFTEAISFVVNCDSQQEIDMFWDKLSDGGEKSRCGWLKDRFGVSWQIVPRALTDMIAGDNPQRADRVMQALMQMDKLDLARLQTAYDQE